MGMLTAEAHPPTVDRLGSADVGMATPVLRVLGQLTAAMTGALRATVAALGGEPAFIVDLSEVAGADYTALPGLGRALRELRVSGQTVVVVAPPRGALAAALGDFGTDRVAFCAASAEEARMLLAQTG